MQRSKIGIHTMTLTHKVEPDDMEHIIDALGEYSERTKRDFLFYTEGKVKRKKNTDDKGRNNVSAQVDIMGAQSLLEMMEIVDWNDAPHNKDEYVKPFLPRIGCSVSHPGVKEFSAFVHLYRDPKTKDNRRVFYIYLKVEPQMLIDGYQSIRIFELEDANNKEALQEAFGREISDLFNMERCCAGITELDTWTADRVDYTTDVKVDNKDEILIFKNLCKWSVLTNFRNKSKYSARGDNFSDKGLLFGNKSWSLAVYDKYDQVLAAYNDIDTETRQRLLDEAENIMRIEVRSEKGKVRSISERFDNGRNIMQFLEFDVAKKLFQDIYGKEIGYKDFYRLYPAKKKLDEAFPLTKRAASQLAREQDKEGKKEEHSKKYKLYWDFLMDILGRKGLKNVLVSRLENGIDDYQNKVRDKSLSAVEKKKIAAIKAKLRYEINTVIRDKVGISPVLIPEAWKYERGLDVPDEKLENPLRDLCPEKIL